MEGFTLGTHVERFCGFAVDRRQLMGFEQRLQATIVDEDETVHGMGPQYRFTPTILTDRRVGREIQGDASRTPHIFSRPSNPYRL